jgi:hypothetical protein
VSHVIGDVSKAATSTKVNVGIVTRESNTTTRIPLMCNLLICYACQIVISVAKEMLCTDAFAYQNYSVGDMPCSGLLKTGTSV